MEEQEEEKSKLQAAIKIDYHIKWLNNIKSSMGNKCKYISHMKFKDDNFIKVVLVNEEGGRDKIEYKLSKDPYDLNNDDYRELLNILHNRLYERSGETL